MISILAAFAFTRAQAHSTRTPSNLRRPRLDRPLACRPSYSSRPSSAGPSCPPQSQRLAPDPLFLFADSTKLPGLLLPASFLELEVPRHPLLLPGLLHELGRMLLERRDGVKSILIIGSDTTGAPGHNHGR